jgi:hypothetical protein
MLMISADRAKGGTGVGMAVGGVGKAPSRVAKGRAVAVLVAVKADITVSSGVAASRFVRVGKTVFVGGSLMGVGTLGGSSAIGRSVGKTSVVRALSVVPMAGLWARACQKTAAMITNNKAEDNNHR